MIDEGVMIIMIKGAPMVGMLAGGPARADFLGGGLGRADWPGWLRADFLGGDHAEMGLRLIQKKFFHLRQTGSAQSCRSEPPSAKSLQAGELRREAGRGEAAGGGGRREGRREAGRRGAGLNLNAEPVCRRCLFLRERRSSGSWGAFCGGRGRRGGEERGKGEERRGGEGGEEEGAVSGAGRRIRGRGCGS